jgi:hypothetical protein
MPYIFGMLRTCTFTKKLVIRPVFTEKWVLTAFVNQIKKKKSIWTPFSTVFRKFGAQKQPKSPIVF